MGRGGDLTDQERAFVYNKIMQNWNSELRQIKVGGRKKITQACIKGGVRVCELTQIRELLQISVKKSFRRQRSTPKSSSIISLDVILQDQRIRMDVRQRRHPGEHSRNEGRACYYGYK